MEDKTTCAGISYDHTLMGDKHFFGGFLNLAQNNIDTLSKAFKERFNVRYQSKQFAEVCFSDKLPDQDYLDRTLFLKTHLPFIKYIGGKEADNRGTFRKNITLFFESIEQLRNFYTHYYHKPIIFPEELYENLDRIFVEVSEEVKDFKAKNDQTRHLLSKNLAEEFEIRFAQNLERQKKLKAQGKKANIHDKQAIKNDVFNNAFYHLIYKKGEDFFATEAYKSKYNLEKTAENGIGLSQSGLIFLLSMFLNKKDTEALKSRVKGFKAKIIRDGEENISGLKFMATHWVFSYLSFKNVKHKLSTDFHKETLLVQIVDELSKVPDEVYKTFNKQTQEEFIEDINEYMKVGNKDLSLEESTVIHPVIRKRYENKFNYFALRFLDEFADFPTLKFQVHIGNYIHDRRIKNIEGTAFQTERSVKERIKVFGKLSQMSNLKAEYVSGLMDEPVDTGWEIFPNPSYNIIENNIPIYIEMGYHFNDEVLQSKMTRKKQKPEELKDRNTAKASKESMIETLQNEKGLMDVITASPIAQLSLNELPAILYELLVKKTPAKTIERKLVGKLNQRLKEIKNYNPENPLPASQISKRLRLNGEEGSINTKKIITLLQKELNYTQEKIDLLAKNRKEYGKKVDGKIQRKYVFGLKEIGSLATDLAMDIKRFMPANVRKEWKGYQHSQLQQSLAFYDKRPEEAFNILQEVWDLKREKALWDTWILNAFQTSGNFERFFELYHEGRKKYIQQQLENIDQYIHNKKLLQKFISQQFPTNFLERHLYTLESLEIEKLKILSKPFILPRGTFDAKPTFIMGKKVTENPELFADWYTYSYQQQHEFQKFYLWPRDYKDLLQNEQKRDPDFTENKKDLSELKQLELLKLKQDILIKKIKTQDLYLKLIVDALFIKVFGKEADISLNDLYLTQQERLEKEKLALKQNQRVEGDDSPNIIKDNFIWSKTVPYIYKKIYDPQVKLKDFGKFKHFLLDDKVEKIISYDLQEIWNKNELEAQINTGQNSYEVIRREELLKEIQLLEKLILDTFSDTLDKHPKEFENDKGNPNFKKYMANGVIRKVNSTAAKEEADWLEHENNFDNLSLEILNSKSEITQLTFLIVLIRNKFGHNQLPAKQFYEIIQRKYSITGETISRLYFNFVKYAASRIKGLIYKEMNAEKV
ncbi:TPA: type VI-B CRISPR-associated RNA-guided ribonuclease Cas13b [Elizabethkingia anophelis]|nr:type VI-B CRISPR-associated RNA-guided ribonuclease Cas13b [Elizabethkingia anophelis]